MGTPLRLQTATFPYGHTRALRDGRVAPVGYELEFLDVAPMVGAYRRMVRELTYDVCEIPITTYVVAKAHGKPFTALPIVVNHMLHHGDVQVGADTGIASPKDLMGKRVGVRAYTVTTGVWVRGMLQSEYGVDPSTITWYTDDEEHVTEFRPPANVVAAPPGTSLVDLFQRGEIDAAFAGPAGLGRVGAPVAGWDSGSASRDAVRSTRPYKPLFPDAAARDAAWLKRAGAYPIHGLICVKDELLQREPNLGRAIYDAFAASKSIYLRELDAGGKPNDAEDQKWTKMRAFVGGDPLPYGIEANRTTLELLLGYAADQGLTPRRFTPEEIFAPV
jgi:4,5-dihydroxyphthalate decarboxylase